MGYGGDCFCRPLRLEYDVPQTVHGMVYRVVPGTVPEAEYTVQIRRGEEFQDLMGFIDRPALDEDFQICNYYVNRNPASVFRNALMLNRFTDDGKLSMFNLSMTVTTPRGVEHREVSWEELPEVLETSFGLRVMPDRPPKAMPWG